MNAIASSSRSPLLSPCLVPPRLFAPSVLSSTSMRPFSSSSARSAANASQNHYRTLDLDRGATKKQIKEKFYELSKKYHPDLTPGDNVAKAKYLSISEAYDTLGNEAKRSNYDRSLAPVPRASPNHTTSHYTRTGRPSTWVHPSTRLPPRPKAHPLKPHHSTNQTYWPPSAQPRSNPTAGANYQNASSSARQAPPTAKGREAADHPSMGGGGSGYGGAHTGGDGSDGINPDTLKSRFNPSTGRAEYYSTNASAPSWGSQTFGFRNSPFSNASGAEGGFAASGQGSGGQMGKPLVQRGGSRLERDRLRQTRDHRETTLTEEFMDGTGGLWMVGALVAGGTFAWFTVGPMEDGWN